MIKKFLSIIAFALSAAAYSQTSCLTNAVDGYASLSGDGFSTTTGGAGGAVVNISTLAQLQTWVASRENNTAAQIVNITAHIEQPGSSSLVLTIKRGANITLIGTTVNAGLKNIGLNFREYNNVIIRNLRVHEVFYPNDGITIDECHHVWIDHCDLFSKNGTGVGVDTYDGLLDLKNGSRFVTISWNRLHSHKKVNLIGHTDNASAQAIDQNIRATFHHNYYYDNDGRMLSLRWGAAHFYNNYLKDIYDYGMAARQGAHALIENNIYENVKTPIATDKFDGVGIVCERGNLFTGTSGPSSITQTDCNWWNSSTLPYSYTLTPTNQLIGLLTSKTGTCDMITDMVCSASITTSGSTTFCQGGSVTLTANSGGTSYIWKNGNLQVGTGQTYNATTAGSYTVEVTCSANLKTTSAPVVVSISSSVTWYADTDGDGVGDANSTVNSCTQPNGYVATSGDQCPADANKTTPGDCGCGKVEGACTDCAGTANGTAYIDNCARCVSGTTGRMPCSASFQAEDACAKEGTVEADPTKPGFFGTGFLNTTNASGTFATFGVNANTSGIAKLGFRYGNTGAGNRTATVTVTGSASTAQVNFVINTSSPNYWTTEEIEIPLTQGDNLVTLTATTVDGLPNLDMMYTVGTGFSAGNCVITSVGDANMGQQSLVVYPNPSQESFTMQSSSSMHINVYNAEGTLVEEIHSQGNTNFGNHYKPGIYVLKLENTNTVNTLKIVKE